MLYCIFSKLFEKVNDCKNDCQMVLDKIKWPTQEEDEDSDVSLEDTCRITGFLRTLIENGTLITLIVLFI